MKAFVDGHRAVYGVEPTSKVLPIAPPAYDRHTVRKADPGLRPARSRRDEDLSEKPGGPGRKIFKLWRA